MLALARRLLSSIRDFLAARLPLSAYLRLPPDSFGTQPLLPPSPGAADPESRPSPTHRPSTSLDTTTTTSDALNSLIDTMRRELDHTKTELARSNDELSRLYERCRLLERSLRDTRDALKSRDSEIDRLRREREKQVERRRSDVSGRDLYRAGSVASLNRDPQHHSRATSAPSSRGTDSSDSLSSTSAAGDEERARARTADAYLTRTDTWSGAQVLQAVHDINSEILQFAAAATEMCTFDRNSRPSSSRAIQAMHDTSARLGPNLARILSNRDHSQDPILVQLALQGCLTLCITRALSSFCVGFPSKSDSLLHQIYHRMALAEPQPTSSKWRALTHQHLHAMYPSLTEYSISELTDTILRWSSDIFLIAGCLTYESSSTSASTTPLSSTTAVSSNTSLRSRFGDHIRRLSKSVTRLAKVLREEILSTSFELIAIDPRDYPSSSSSTTTPTTNHPPSSSSHNNSSSNPNSSNGLSGPLFHERTMIDAFGEYGHSHGCVLATTELGLRCVTRMGTREGVGSEEEVLLEQRVLLMPKVVLESVLDVLDR
ncbi:hypothetical protein D9756_003549 [Leucocoprinus leucothites]|uniref:Uncharacterized protein n=1 Tax=Leucocoprinus leucothites TaxID=201217 RepID=A0A8H5G6Z5_9AGAR|nr:hypothetical protein D9756_003549 [Leucoagaricus leucothites]